MARGPLRRGAQCSRIGCIGLRPALMTATVSGTEFIRDRDVGDLSPPTFGRGGHNIFCHPQYFVIKSNVVVQISWLHYCWKSFPSIKPRNK